MWRVFAGDLLQPITDLLQPITGNIERGARNGHVHGCIPWLPNCLPHMRNIGELHGIAAICFSTRQPSLLTRPTRRKPTDSSRESLICVCRAVLPPTRLQKSYSMSPVPLLNKSQSNPLLARCQGCLDAPDLVCPTCRRGTPAGPRIARQTPTQVLGILRRTFSAPDISQLRKDQQSTHESTRRQVTDMAAPVG